MQKVGFAIVGTILIELALFIIVGNWIGVLPTLLFVIISAFLGIYFSKKNGAHSMKAIQQSISQGIAPGVTLIDGFISFVGAILLIIPGIVTSVIGAFMMLSFSKKLFKPMIFYWLRKKMKRNQIIIYQK